MVADMVVIIIFKEMEKFIKLQIQKLLLFGIVVENCKVLEDINIIVFAPIIIVLVFRMEFIMQIHLKKIPVKQVIIGIFQQKPNSHLYIL